MTMNTPTVGEGAIAFVTNHEADRELEELDPKLVYGILRKDGMSGETYEVLDLERFDDVPRRQRGKVFLDQPESLVEYVNRHKVDEFGTAMYAHEETDKITAVLDEPSYHGDPQWRQHTAELGLLVTRNWAAWKQHDREMVSQTEFGHFIEENLTDIGNPPSAEMLEMVLSIEATTQSTFKSAQRLQSGERQFAFEETINTTAGRAGQLTIPERFTLHLPIYLGGDLIVVEALLRYRLRDGRLTLGYQLERADEAKRQAFEQIAGAVREGTGVPLYFGRCPASS